MDDSWDMSFPNDQAGETDIPWNNEGSNVLEGAFPEQDFTPAPQNNNQPNLGNIGQGNFNPMNPALFFGQSEGSNPITQAGLMYGQNFIQSNFGSWVAFWESDTLKYYFKVDNKYVLNKIRILLVPYTVKDWNRKLDYDHVDPRAMTSFKPPQHDINAPDLYIPFMAFVSFVLLMGYTMGVYAEFNPEVIGIVASSTLVLLFLEMMLLRFGFSFLGANASVSLLEYAAYCGYKYVGLVFNILTGHALGSWAFYIAMVALSCSAGYFMFQTLSIAVSFPDGSPIRKKYFLLIVSCLQFFISLFLIKDAAPTSVI